MGRKLRLRDNESGIVELTSRCIQGRFLTRPSPVVNDRILGIIGRAQRMTQIRLHALVYLSNHDHGLCGTDSVQQMSAFKGFVNGNIARELGREYDWKEKFWGRRYHSASVADTEEDQQKRLRYILSNGCKEGLVDSPLDWPGVNTAWALSRGIWTLQGTWLDRSSDRNNGPKKVTETVQLTPMPFMESWRRQKNNASGSSTRSGRSKRKLERRDEERDGAHSASRESSDRTLTTNPRVSSIHPPHSSTRPTPTSGTSSSARERSRKPNTATPRSA